MQTASDLVYLLSCQVAIYKTATCHILRVTVATLAQQQTNSAVENAGETNGFSYHGNYCNIELSMFIEVLINIP